MIDSTPHPDADIPDHATKETPRPSRLTWFGRELLAWGKSGIKVLLIFLFLTLFVGQVSVVHGRSMESTLHPGDRIFVEKISKRFGNIDIGDVLVFRPPQQTEEYIKRVIGLPGDRLEIRDGHLYRNDVLIKEDYAAEYPADFMGPITVAPDNLFLMGDNRPNSHDSRNFGQVPMGQVTGRAIFRFYPFDSLGTP